MGDLLLSLPAVHAVRKHWPQTQIHLLIHQDWIPLLQGHPDVDQIHPWNPQETLGWGIGRTALWLRRHRFDAILILNPSKLFHAASFLAGIRTRVGYRRKWGFLLTHSLHDTKAARNLHETEYNLELLGLLGIQGRATHRLFLPELADSRKQVQTLLAHHNLPNHVRPIALHPWTTNPGKGLPLHFFWSVARELGMSGHPIVLIGVPPVENRDMNPPPGLINLFNKTPLGLLPELLRHCSVLISNDSGPVHLAAAVGTPTVIVAPSSHDRQLQRWKPLGGHCTILLDPTPDQVFQAIRTVQSS